MTGDIVHDGSVIDLTAVDPTVDHPITEYADGSEVVAPVEPQFGANWDPGHYDNV